MASAIAEEDKNSNFTAAWVARKAMPDCELVPAAYGEEPPDPWRKVYILDFSYPREATLAIDAVADSLIVLDHHKIAQPDCEGLDFCVFSMERPGCRMACDHFFPGQWPPHWLLRTEDRDLWRFDYKETPMVHAYVASLPMTMEAWDKLDRMNLEDIAARGASIRAYFYAYNEKAAKEARVLKIGAELVVAVNVPYHNASEMG